ncbi:MAG TPA: ProQ/FinO family protein [Albitalea sp.]
MHPTPSAPPSADELPADRGTPDESSAPQAESAAVPAPASAPAPPGAPAAPTLSPAECAAQLKQRFPALFGGGFKPLKLRIQADIQERAPGVFSKQALSAFFRRHTGSTGYLIAMSRASHRIDLDGQPSGEVSDEHRNAAIEELARRRALHQAREEQVEDARRKRAALLRDFETTTLTRTNFCALKGIAPEALDALLDTARKEQQERQSRMRERAPAGPQRRERRPEPGRRPQR